MVESIAKSSRYELKKLDNGSILIKSPLIKGLVLSGGGSRGMVYPGMLRCMSETKQLELITHVSGASAGAMTASFIALGIDYKDIEKICMKVNLFNLLDNEGYTRIRARGERFRNFFEVVYYIQIKAYLLQVRKQLTVMSEDEIRDFNFLNSKLNSYSACLAKYDCKLDTFDDLIALCDSSHQLHQLDTAFKILSKKMLGKGGALECPRFSFSDFERVRNILPQSQKYQIKHLSVAVANTSTSVLEIHNIHKSPNKSVAEKIQLSGAHPLLFSPKKNRLGEFRTDGAMLNNMPSDALIECGLDPHEILCVALTSENSLNYRVNDAKKTSLEFVSGAQQFLDHISRLLLGTEIHQYLANESNREKIFYHMGTMLFLNAGDIGITDLSNTDEQKRRALTLGYESTEKFYLNKDKIFDNYLLAMMFLGQEALKKIILSGNNSDLYFSALTAKQLGDFQNVIVSDLRLNNLDNLEGLLDEIKMALKNENLKLNDWQQKKILCLCVKQINYLSEGRLERYCIQQIKDNSLPKNQHWFLELLGLIRKYVKWIFYPSPTAKTPEQINEETLITEKKQHKYQFFTMVNHKIFEDINVTDQPVNLLTST